VPFSYLKGSKTLLFQGLFVMLTAVFIDFYD